MKRLLPLLLLVAAGCQGTRPSVKAPTATMPPAGVAQPSAARPVPSPATAIAAEQQSLEQKQKALQRSLGDLQALLDAQTRRQQTVTAQLESARNDLYESAKEIRTVKERVDGLLAQQQTNLAAIAGVRQQVQAKQAELDQLRAALSGAPARIAELEQQAQKERAARQAQDELLKAREREIASLRSALDEHKRLLKEQKVVVAKPVAQTAAAPATPAVDPAAQAVAAADAAAAVAAANNLLAAGQAAEAQARYEAVLKTRPSMIPALNGLAGAQYARGDFVGAAKTADRVLDLDPRNAQALGVKGLVYRKEGSPSRASSLLGQAVDNDPQDPRLRNYYGIALNDRGRRSEAIEQFRKATELDPGYAEAHFNAACLLATAQPPKLDEAREHYRRAVALGSERDADLDRILGAP